MRDNERKKIEGQRERERKKEKEQKKNVNRAKIRSREGEIKCMCGLCVFIEKSKLEIVKKISVPWEIKQFTYLNLGFD